MTPIPPVVGSGVVTYGELSTDGGKAGPSGGPVRLATITFQAIAPGTASNLILSDVVLTTVDAVSQGAVPVKGVVNIAPLPTARSSASSRPHRRSTNRR